MCPQRVEFWQGALDRRHERIVYLRDECGWRLERAVGGRPVSGAD
ncbi:pyridoxine 5'-phosphate oxidase C-terminal domain-containing protein [Microbacterium sp. JZ31]